ALAKPREERFYGWGDRHCPDFAYGGRRLYRVRPVSTAVGGRGYRRDSAHYLPPRRHRYPHGRRLFSRHQWPPHWGLHDAEWPGGRKRLWWGGPGLRRIGAHFAVARRDGAAAARRAPQFLPDTQL